MRPSRTGSAKGFLARTGGAALSLCGLKALQNGILQP
jgi:hypothetical protein